MSGRRRWWVRIQRAFAIFVGLSMAIRLPHAIADATGIGAWGILPGFALAWGNAWLLWPAAAK